MRSLLIGPITFVIQGIYFTCQCSFCWVDSSAGVPAIGPATPPTAEMSYLLWCSETRTHAMKAMLRGELTLLEVAAAYQEVESHRPEHMPHGYSTFSGDTVEEQICRHVIAYVSAEQFHDSQREAVLACLQAELDDLLSRGTLRLPIIPYRVCRQDIYPGDGQRVEQ